MSQKGSWLLGVAVAAGVLAWYLTKPSGEEMAERQDSLSEEQNVVKDHRPVWNPKSHRTTPVPISEFGSHQFNSVSAIHRDLERCKIDAALAGAALSHRNPFSKFAKTVPFTCTFGEIDLDDQFYPLGCATFLSSRVLLTAWHVACAVLDTSRICVCIESEFFLLSDGTGRATCRQRLVRIDVAEARSLPVRDIGILLLDGSACDVIEAIFQEDGLTFPSLTLDKMSDFVMVLHTDNATEHTVVDIGEVSTSAIGYQIATHMISDGTFGTCGAAVFNEDGCIAGVYIGAEVHKEFTKGVISVNDIILNEFEEFAKSLLSPFLINNQRLIRPCSYHDFINPMDRKESYVPEGARFDVLHQTTEHGLCVIQCLGEGGKHGYVQTFSNKFNIESDHFPPFQAYEKSSASWSAKYYRDGRSRKNEEELPALSLPYKFHRQFITTGNSAETKVFAQEQAKMMSDKKTFKDAIVKNIEAYEKAGLFKTQTFIDLYSEPKFAMSQQKAQALVKAFRAGIKKALLQHEALGFITTEQRLELNAYTDKRK